MKARDIMAWPVITARPDDTVRHVAQLFLEHRISAVPVVDAEGRLVGIVSEGDLLRRVEIGTERQPGSWLQLLIGDQALARAYVKAHGRKVSDVMTERVITATPDTPLTEIAALLEKHRIKRVPILSEGKLVGIVSRANLVRAMANAKVASEEPLSDAAIRDALLEHLRQQPWAHASQISVTVKDGVVELWGLSYSDAEREALRVAAENIPGVRAIHDNRAFPPIGIM